MASFRWITLKPWLLIKVIVAKELREFDSVYPWNDGGMLPARNVIRFKGRENALSFSWLEGRKRHCLNDNSHSIEEVGGVMMGWSVNDNMIG
nr:hypothetical protein [Providencia stuartii]